MEIVENHRAPAGYEIAPPDNVVVIPPVTLRRLVALQRAAEGAAGAAQAAIDYANQKHALFQQALTDACEDLGVHTPPGERRHVKNFDQVTGRVEFDE